MPGMIKHEDVERVRQAADLADVVGQTVQLKRSGTGEYMGLCPFHDEKTPSFAVRPALGVWHCFGCGLGGDVFAFVERRDGVGFADAVEILADRYGITLHYEEGSGGQRRQGSQRSRLLQVNEETQKFFTQHLMSKEGLAARQEIGRRNFTKAQAEYFGVGYAPRGWNNLTNYLASKGFTQKEMVDAGVARQGSRGVYDYFRGRVTWPIRDTSGRTLGFGARKLYDDDTIEAKYINTPDTQLYHKEQVLYGLNLARKEIIRQHSIVIVEGYTDVMAMHCAGVRNAVATCGTAFGFEHAKIVRRLIDDDNMKALNNASSVIFTFDGDAAGQKAALHAFRFDSAFLAQTYVAVAHDNLDPCDLRLKEGDAAVQQLIRARRPLFTFVVDTTLQRFDLRFETGQVSAMEAVAPIVAQMRDRSMMDVYIRRVAQKISVSPDTVRAEVMRFRRSLRVRDENPYLPNQYSRSAQQSPIETAADARITAAANPKTVHDIMDRNYMRRLVELDANKRTQAWRAPNYRIPDNVFLLEQQFLGTFLQIPTAFDQSAWTNDLTSASFAVPSFSRLFDAINRAATNPDGTWRGLPKPGDSISQWYHAVHREGGMTLDETIDALCVLPLPFYLNERDAGERRATFPMNQAESSASRQGQGQTTAGATLRFPEPTAREKMEAAGLMRRMIDAGLGERLTSLQKVMRQTTDEQEKINLLQEVSQLQQRRKQLSQQQYEENTMGNSV
jgi:DNA primase